MTESRASRALQQATEVAEAWHELYDQAQRMAAFWKDVAEGTNPLTGAPINYSGQPRCWLAFYGDRSDFVVFTTEAEANRHAVAHSMLVSELEYGQSANAVT